MEKLISELQRLYFYKGQIHHDQDAKGESYFPAGPLTKSILETSLGGSKTVALNLVSEAGQARAMIFDFDGVAQGKGKEHWEALISLSTRMQTELDLPAPAVTISGRKGWGLWLSLEQPVPVAHAQLFVNLVYKEYLANIPKDQIDLRPDVHQVSSAAQAVIKLPPCVHRASGMWAAFIDPSTGGDYVEVPGLQEAPSMAAQAELLANVKSISPQQFGSALFQLQAKQGHFNQEQKGPTAVPLYAKADKGYLPPCIASLAEAGAPHDIQYNTVNLNLKAFCSSAQMGEDEATELALKVAEASETHPSSKDVGGKLKNFHSNSPRAFYCDYARNTPAWSKQFGGLKACQGCKLNPGVAPDNRSSQDKKDSPILEEAVALDLLAYAKSTGEALPQIRSVWPLSELASDKGGVAFCGIAAKALEKGLTSSAFFGELDSYLSESKIDAFQKKEIGDKAQEFYATLAAHQVTEEAGKAAMQRALHLERRFSLSRAARDALKQGPSVAANVVAMQLRQAAEDSLKAEQGTGPIKGLRDELFKALARQESAVVPTPFPRFNDLLHGGFGGGKLYTLIAPPKAGKTTLAGACMDYAASQGCPVLYVGYEMGRPQMVEYSLARRTSINSKRIETRDLSAEEAEQLAASLEDYLGTVGQYLEIWEAGITTSIADMAAWVTKAKANTPGKTPLVVVDYLQLAYTGIPEIDRHPSETKRVTEVAVACKHLARSSGAAVLALSSVTKAAENDSRNNGEIDVTAARDSLAIIHASDGVLAMQTATVVVSEGRGDSKTETELDPWGFIANQLRQQGREADAVTLERALLKLDKEGYAQGGFPGKGVRARLSLLRHRGSTGDVALYYRKAFHSLEEVSLPGMEALEVSNHNPEISINVFQKYVKDKAPEMQQETFPGFEAPAEAAPVPQPQVAPEIEYQYITQTGEAVAAIAALKGQLGVDLETTGLSPITSQARLLQVSDGATTLVIDLWKAGGLSAYREALEGRSLVAHNAVFEMGFFSQAGIKVTLDCTMIANHVLTGKRVKLKDLALHYLGLDMSKEQQVSDWSAAELTEAQLAYAALDAKAVVLIFSFVSALLEEQDSLRAYQITRDAQPAIVSMELAGMGFDAVKQAELIEGLTKERDAHLGAIKLALGADFNPNSGAQLTAYLLEQLGGVESEKYAKWPKTPSGKALKTGSDDLKKGLVYLPDAAASLIKEHLLPLKNAEKKLSAFGQSLADKINPVTGRIHADFNLAGTETGRMSCSKPNLQQIPRDKEFRALFKAPEGRSLVISDYSQAELRVGAEVAGEEGLIEAYRLGQDTHRKTVALLLGIADQAQVTKEQRQLAKAVNFGLLFGQGAKGLQAYAAASYGVTISEEQARKYRDAWFAAYPAFKAWHNKSGKAAEKSLSVRTPAGRERRWENKSDFSVMAAYNTPVQGGAAEAMLAALAHLDKALQGLDAVPIAVVHDEVIVECAAEIAEQVKGLLEAAMVQGFADIFPKAPLLGVAEAGIGQSWADK